MIFINEHSDYIDRIITRVSNQIFLFDTRLAYIYATIEYVDIEILNIGVGSGGGISQIDNSNEMRMGSLISAEVGIDKANESGYFLISRRNNKDREFRK